MPGLVPYQHHQQYRPIQPKPSPPRYMTSGSDVVVEGRSRVMSSSDRRTSTPASFSPSAWPGHSELNVPRLPAAAHGTRPLPAAHAVPRGSLPGSATPLSLTIDDQAPLDCSRKSSGGPGAASSAEELDGVATVLNLTVTSGHGSGAVSASQGNPATGQFDALPPCSSPSKNSTIEEDYPTALPLLSSLVQSEVQGSDASAGGFVHIEGPSSSLVKDSTREQLSEQSRPTSVIQPTVNLTTSGQDAARLHTGSAPLERMEERPSSPSKNSTIEQISEPTAVQPEGQRDIEMIFNDTESVKQSASTADRTHDITMILDNLEQRTETKTSGMTFCVLDDEVKPVLAGLSSNAVTLPDCELAEELPGTAVVDMTLGDLNEVKAVPVSSALSDVTRASDRHDLETTSDDLDNLRTEQRLETNVDDMWRDELHSPASEGFFLVLQ